jgi:hypothetical protein
MQKLRLIKDLETVVTPWLKSIDSLQISDHLI